MKKFIALAIAVVMLAALAVPAFAATFTEESAETDAEVTVTYAVDEGYTVTIPDALTFGTAATVSVVGNIENAKIITVTGAFTLGGAAYALVDSEGEAFDGTILTSSTGATVNDSVSINTAWVGEDNNGPAAAGTYTDTLTFAVA